MQTAFSAPSERVLNVYEAADFLNVRPQTLAKWRCHRSQPLPYHKVGRVIRYRLADLEAFLARGRVAE